MISVPEGPATAALERSLKRRRMDSPMDAFSFTDVFNNLEEGEKFPVISWDFDDEEDESDKGAGPSKRPMQKSLPELSSLSPPSKKKHCGLTRCKSYRSGLSELAKEFK